MSAYTHHERLSAVDAAFLAVEDDCAHMHIGSVNIFDPGPLRTAGGGVDIERIRRLFELKLYKIPRFRQKLAYTPLAAAPVWIDDTSFNLDYHVRHTALPHPGDRHQLERLASRILSQHLDRRRPLWETWIVEGLEGDLFALISKIHHAMADGISGIDLVSATMGKDPEFRPSDDAPAWIPRQPTGAGELLMDDVRHQLSASFDLLRSREAEPGLNKQPATSVDLSTRFRHALAAVSAAIETTPATPLNVDIGPNRRFAWTRVSLERLGAIRKLAGGTLNDVVLAIVAGAVRGFLLRRGCALHELDFRVMVPVSVRSDDERGQLGNRVSQLLVHLPVAVDDPLERLRMLSEQVRTLKHSGQAQGGQMLTGLFELVPARIAAPLERAAARRSFGNMVVTNVPASPATAYMLGARLLESYPLVPLASQQALGVAVLSYDGSLHWGVNADFDAIPDVDDFVALLDKEVEVLHGQASTRAPGAPYEVLGERA